MRIIITTNNNRSETPLIQPEELVIEKRKDSEKDDKIGSGAYGIVYRFSFFFSFLFFSFLFFSFLFFSFLFFSFLFFSFLFFASPPFFFSFLCLTLLSPFFSFLFFSFLFFSFLFFSFLFFSFLFYSFLFFFLPPLSSPFLLSEVFVVEKKLLSKSCFDRSPFYHSELLLFFSLTLSLSFSLSLPLPLPLSNNSSALILQDYPEMVLKEFEKEVKVPFSFLSFLPFPSSLSLPPFPFPPLSSSSPL